MDNPDSSTILLLMQTKWREMMIAVDKTYRSINIKTALFAILALGITLIGCTSKTTKEEEFSGFLSDYSQLTKGSSVDGDNAVVLKWVSPVLSQRKYTKVMLDPVVIYPAPQPGPQLRTEVLKSMLAYLNKEAKHQVEQAYEVVTEPGKDVVRLRAAITGVETSPEDLAAYEYVPIALALAGVSTATGSRSQMVEIFLEAELTDSLSGERLAAAVRKGFGEPVENKDEQVELENVRPVLDGWARSAVNLLKATIK
ncbi:DUF3313 domain-containing protein [Photobacterium proteolyticum]|nr:DUF3313 domain-containing protein [Photobacterium proteolyticum]